MFGGISASRGRFADRIFILEVAGAALGMVIKLEKNGEAWSTSLQSTEGFHVVEIDGVHKETALLHANSLLKIAFDVLGDMPVRSTSVMRYHKFGWLAHSSGRKPL